MKTMNFLFTVVKSMTILLSIFFMAKSSHAQWPAFSTFGGPTPNSPAGRAMAFFPTSNGLPSCVITAERFPFPAPFSTTGLRRFDITSGTPNFTAIESASYFPSSPLYYMPQSNASAVELERFGNSRFAIYARDSRITLFDVDNLSNHCGISLSTNTENNSFQSIYSSLPFLSLPQNGVQSQLKTVHITSVVCDPINNRILILARTNSVTVPKLAVIELKVNIDGPICELTFESVRRVNLGNTQEPVNFHGNNQQIEMLQDGRILVLHQANFGGEGTYVRLFDSLETIGTDDFISNDAPVAILPGNPILVGTGSSIYGLEVSPTSNRFYTFGNQNAFNSLWGTHLKAFSISGNQILSETLSNNYVGTIRCLEFVYDCNSNDEFIYIGGHNLRMNNNPAVSNIISLNAVGQPINTPSTLSVGGPVWDLLFVNMSLQGLLSQHLLFARENALTFGSINYGILSPRFSYCKASNSMNTISFNLDTFRIIVSDLSSLGSTSFFVNGSLVQCIPLSDDSCELDATLQYTQDYVITAVVSCGDGEACYNEWLPSATFDCATSVNPKNTNSNYSIEDVVVNTKLFEESERDITIYPNPVSNSCFVKGNFEDSLPIEVIIRDTVGKIVWKKDGIIYSNDGINLDVSVLSQGIYIASIIQKGEIRTKPFIKR